MDDILELDTRRKLYRLLVKNPGLNLTSIAEMLKISIPLAVYHLAYMEKHGVLVASKEAGFLRYYTQEHIGARDKKMLSLLRQETLLKIVLFLLQHPYSLHKEILKNFDMSPSTLSYHLKKLVAGGIITEGAKDGKSGYVVVNENEVIRFLIRYNPSRVLKRFTDAWVDFNVR